MKVSHVWRQLSIVLISGLMSIIATVIANRLSYPRKKGPQLEYRVIETKPFKAPDYNFAVYNVVIRNTGDKYISGIKSMIRIPLAELKEVIITADPNLDYTERTWGDTLRLEIPSLNPAETIAVSTWAISKDSLPDSPIVSVRAEGVTGIQRALIEEKQPNYLLFGILVFVTIWIMLFAVYMIRREYPSRID